MSNLAYIAHIITDCLIVGGPILVIVALLDRKRTETIGDMARITVQHCAAGFGVVVLTTALIGV